MQRVKKFIKKLILPVLIIAVTVILSVSTYHKVLHMEEEICWDTLEATADNINNEIQIRFKDNIAILKLVANAMIQEGRVESYDAISEHINDFQKMTIFSRIDVIYPDNTVLMQSGEKIKIGDGFSYEEVAAEGEHISNRKTDIENGKEVVYYFVPVEKEGQTLALLVGVIDCESLPDIFKTTAYNGEAFSCLIDYKDGSFIMDDWHEKLGNLYEMKQRKMLKGYEDVDLIDDVSKAKTGAIAYKSAENGKNSYMYYTPVGIFDWELLIVVQEQVAFASVLQLRQIIYLLEFVEIAFLAVYFVWTLITVDQLEKSKEKIEMQKKRFEQLSYSDTLTMTYNRNKYNEEIEKYQGMDHFQVGIALFDLNGLKKINDEQGHRLGDMLIKNTAKHLCSLFENKIYRIEGDEFVVLDPDTTESQFYDDVRAVCKMMNDNNISISVGMTWAEHGKEFNEKIKEADRRMYEQKNAYYQQQAAQ